MTTKVIHNQKKKMDRPPPRLLECAYPRIGVNSSFPLPGAQRSGHGVSTAQSSGRAEALTPGRLPKPVLSASTTGTRARFVEDEFFGHQPSTTSTLPDPSPLIENLTRAVIEILAGARDLEQISRWVTDDVYRHLLKRVVLSARARHATGRKAGRPHFTIGSISQFEPRDGAVEAVVVVHNRARTRAVAVRLEGLDNRWRATAINVL